MKSLNFAKLLNGFSVHKRPTRWLLNRALWHFQTIDLIAQLNSWPNWLQAGSECPTTFCSSSNCGQAKVVCPNVDYIWYATQWGKHHQEHKQQQQQVCNRITQCISMICMRLPYICCCWMQIASNWCETAARYVTSSWGSHWNNARSQGCADVQLCSQHETCIYYLQAAYQNSSAHNKLAKRLAYMSRGPNKEMCWAQGGNSDSRSSTRLAAATWIRLEPGQWEGNATTSFLHYV